MLTLFDFFAPSTEQVIRALRHSAQDRALETMHSGSLSKTLQAKMAQMLDVSLVSIMLRAWQDYGEVRQALLESQRRPSETVTVALPEHSIESSQEPSISANRGDVALLRISFFISLEILVEALVLKVQGGRIEEIEAGWFVASGILQCEGVTLCENKLQPLKIPANFRIGHKEQADANQEAAEPALHR